MISKELFKAANTLEPYTEYESKEVEALIESASNIAKSFSGSWLGYHSRVYYENFEIPPPGAAFSQEWGLMHSFSGGTRGEWNEYDFDEVVSLIYQRAGDPSIDEILALAHKAEEVFDDARTLALSVIHSSHFDLDKDKFLASLVEKIENSKIFDDSDYISYCMPKGDKISRDMIAIEKGSLTPPHMHVLAKTHCAKFPFNACRDLKKLIIKLANHVKNLEGNAAREERIGTNIFIGHGRSLDWRVLKDFVYEKLKLPYDEFNRVPIAGYSNITRLSQMLDQASFAFLVMTAEDEQSDGNLRARMNVIHEVGLFQGRLGFERAIVLLEDGCEEFSNIQGLGQLRFPKGNIAAVFEDIRAVLERESIIESPK